MQIIILLLVFIATLAALLAVFNKKTNPNKNDEPVKEVAEECCGAHEICETDLINRLNEEIIYYDDEELDKFAKRSDSSYSNDEIDEFRDVAYTLQTKEIEPWLRSLEKRGILLPEIIKSEIVFMMID
ncbi:MAG: hypothetical protein N4A49_05690 [Marinifilaceae bacterium]|jgi:hypothetical protein|nr:hypothetical protein [Marinifilaceae bacterium]